MSPHYFGPRCPTVLSKTSLIWETRRWLTILIRRRKSMPIWNIESFSYWLELVARKMIRRCACRCRRSETTSPFRARRRAIRIIATISSTPTYQQDWIENHSLMLRAQNRTSPLVHNGTPSQRSRELVTKSSSSVKAHHNNENLWSYTFRM